MGNWIGDESDPWNQVDDTLGVEQDGEGGGYWVGDESDPWNPDSDSGNQRDNAAVELGTRLLDVPADFGNTLTGTGENVGWMGVADRELDPRSWGPGEDPDWAEPSDETTGISGFWRGATGATGEVVDETTSGVSAGLMNSPKLLALALLAFLALLAPYAQTAANVTGD